MQHPQPLCIGRILRGQTDSPAGKLPAQHLDLLADDVVDRPEDVAAQLQPGVDGQYGRNIAEIELGLAFSAPAR